MALADENTADETTKDHAPPAAPAGELLGVLEDDRLRAVVTTTGDDTVVTIEGRLDENAAPVVDDLLEAVDRWHRRAERRASRTSTRPPRDLGRRRATTRLWIDARGVEWTDASTWQVLDRHRRRWLRERGPCLTWGPTIGQRSNR